MYAYRLCSLLFCFSICFRFGLRIYLFRLECESIQLKSKIPYVFDSYLSLSLARMFCFVNRQIHSIFSIYNVYFVIHFVCYFCCCCWDRLFINGPMHLLHDWKTQNMVLNRSYQNINQEENWNIIFFVVFVVDIPPSHTTKNEFQTK